MGSISIFYKGNFLKMEKNSIFGKNKRIDLKNNFIQVIDLYGSNFIIRLLSFNGIIFIIIV